MWSWPFWRRRPSGRVDPIGVGGNLDRLADHLVEHRVGDRASPDFAARYVLPDVALRHAARDRHRVAGMISRDHQLGRPKATTGPAACLPPNSRGGLPVSVPTLVR